MPSVTPLLRATDVPPIPAAQRWRASYDGRLGALIDLAQAVPGSAPPQDLLDRLGEAGRTAAATAYGPILGDTALRDALARDITTLYGGPVRPDEIAITAGCNQAFFVAMLALAAAGDEILLPTPWYFNHKMTLDMLGMVARPLPCDARDSFVPSVAVARRLIGPRTRAVVLVTPNNPTGATYPEPVIHAFAELARETGITLILDETYRDFLPDGVERPHRLFADPAWSDSTMQLYSFSKSYAVPGHRLGAIVASASVLAEVAKVLDCMMICPPRAAQAAITWAVDGTRGWRSDTRAAINGRAALFRQALAGAMGWRISAIGAYFAFVEHPFASGEEAAATLAAHAGLLTLPGSFFGPGQDRHLRFAFANVDDGAIRAIGERLKVVDLAQPAVP